MTNREAYVFGWVFGRLSAEAFPEDIGGDVVLAAPRPYTANARVISDAHRIGIFGDPVQRCAAGDGEKRGGSVFNSRNMTEKGGESRPVHCTGERKTV